MSARESLFPDTEYERFIVYTLDSGDTEPWPWSGEIESRDDAEAEVARLRVEYPHRQWLLLSRAVKATWLDV